MSTGSQNLYEYYVPSNVAAIVVAVIFLILILLHAWKVISTRQWYTVTAIVGGIFEMIGLAARAWSHNNLSAKAPYIIQIILILLAPVIFSAVIYMFLGRLIRASQHQNLSLIRINVMTKLFVCGDILCFFIQASGAGKLVNAKTADEISTAQNTVLAGLILQIVFFCVFISCAIVFNKRVLQVHIARTVDPKLRLQPMLVSLYLCSVLIIVRNVYRVVEYKTGESGYLQSHEWPTYALDVVLMAVLMTVSLSWYLANIKPPSLASYPLYSRDGSS
ncbi:RTA1 like protein-domain-containing protein [Penicillium cataractarum]|uniref:RTA1 like protein-domain-containing protein n=1 Tax=Penicillium cataractarum TaxID=2100454 RepID=A0A9W9V748_9EURO|nr:RTA1 like protein-domain-containing protein [Penicillium cataractarum]KAJ5368771.1 RTA1 like protein-domain-containing protein [Penicillium cataractarum]